LTAKRGNLAAALGLTARFATRSRPKPPMPPVRRDAADTEPLAESRSAILRQADADDHTLRTLLRLGSE
jgi:hypothetical protein